MMNDTDHSNPLDDKIDNQTNQAGEINKKWRKRIWLNKHLRDWITAIATVCAMVFTGWLVCQNKQMVEITRENIDSSNSFTRDQLAITKQMADAATISATATREELIAIQEDLRARIKLIYWNIDSTNIVGYPFSYVNIGKSSALSIDFNIRFPHTKAGIDSMIGIMKQRVPQPGEMQNLEAGKRTEVTIPFETIRKEFYRADTTYYVVCVSYYDVFGKLHHSIRGFQRTDPTFAEVDPNWHYED